RHGPTTADVLAWGEQAAQRLAELAGAAQRGEEVQRELAESRLRLRARADELTAARAQAAHRLAVAVTAELAQLAMPNARVHVTVEPTQRPGPHGAETVQIALAANPGSPARSVAKAASGGELSRIMLALEVVIAQAAAARRESGCGGVGTFVFDEVDAGVGGRAALAIGQRLAALARHTQVVVVTHLPQVAAFADRHLVVHKAVDGHVTASGVHPVEADERLAELARMMAGTDSALAREHAAALLREAAGRVDNTAVGVDAQPREHATRSANHLQAVPDSTSIPRGRARRGGRVAASA
ncbi:DNA repair protein RecN, partial [Kineosphaera limosa NBRC 100340]